jgi:hypothetical protein
MRDPAVARWQAHLHGLATPIRELSGLEAGGMQQGDFRLKISDFRFEIWDCGFRITDLERRSQETESRRKASKIEFLSTSG